MRHHLKTVAENNRIDPVKFTEIATEPKASNKFGVCEEGHGYFTVSTWYCDELVAHVKSVLANS